MSAAISHQRHVSPAGRTAMFSVVAFPALAILTLRRRESRVEALIKVWSRLREEHHAPLIDLVDLSLRFGHCGRRCDDARAPDPMRRCRRAFLQQGDKRPQCVMKVVSKRPEKVPSDSSR